MVEAGGIEPPSSIYRIRLIHKFSLFLKTNKS